MTLLIFSILLWGGAAALGAMALRRGDHLFEGGLRDAIRELGFVAPRIVIGVLGAGFMAELMPPEIMRAHLGAESGSLGVLVATVVGGLTPGGPVLVFALAGAALSSGVGLPQILTYVTAWLLFSVNRTLVWEAPVMGWRYVRDRMLMSLPIPILVGHLALLLA